MRDRSGQGIEPTPLAFAGGVFTTGPSGKPWCRFFFFFNIDFKNFIYLLIWLHQVLVAACGIVDLCCFVH